jgi:hypothetical protein
MFKALRDHAVILADLSLHNPNVFYELGIRHVMSPRGTVLMCRHGSELPFDVKLSRVIFYKYDGQSLDFEEAERVIQELQVALEAARRGSTPDSPVYALLERVVQDQVGPNGEKTVEVPAGYVRAQSLDPYQEIIAAFWARQGKALSDLRREFGQSVFGARALAHLCLAANPIPAEAANVASDLYDLEQYDLAKSLYGKLDAAGLLQMGYWLRFASSISENDRSLRGAQRGLEYIQRALDAASAQPPGPSTDSDLARCYHALAGMHLWKWELSKSDNDLATAIETLQKSQQFCEKAMAQDESYPIGRAGLVHLRLLLILRIRYERDRLDHEGHRDAILGLKPSSQTHPRDVSYLLWYQAIALADAGDAEGSRRMAVSAFAYDGKIMHRPDCSDIGRRQYTHVRRFLEHYAHVLRNPVLMGHIAQLLHVGHPPAP